MKKLLLAGVALGALTVAANAADIYRPAPVAVKAVPTCGLSGIMGAYGLAAWHDAYNSSYEGNSWGMGGYGKANFCNVIGGLGLQIETFGEASTSSDLGGYWAGQVGTQAHLYTRNSAYALGITGGVGMLQSNYADYSPGALLNIGLDGHLYFGNLTLAAQAVYWKSVGAESGNYGAIDNAWQASLEARYFLTPNTKIAGLVGYHTDIDVADYYRWKGFFVGVNAEHKFGNSPFAIFADLTHYNGKIDGDKMNVTVAKVGFNIHFNQPNLISVDRNGASFRTPMIDTSLHNVNSIYR